MNSHQRRVCDRYWSYDVRLECNDEKFNEVLEWLENAFGSCSFKTRKMPLWCWRPEYVPGPGNFVMHNYGASIFFRKQRDYAAFLLRWEQ